MTVVLSTYTHVGHSLSTILQNTEREAKTNETAGNCYRVECSILSDHQKVTSQLLPFPLQPVRRGITAWDSPFGWVAAHSSQDQRHRSVSRNAALADTSAR